MKIRKKKYRVWDVTNKRMITDFDRYIIVFSSDGFGVYDCINPETNDYDTPKLVQGEMILMESIEVPDKNGKDIYKGDILRFAGEDGEVYYDKGRYIMAGFYNPSQDNPGDAFGEYAELEMVGNIYENPDWNYHSAIDN